MQCHLLLQSLREQLLIVVELAVYQRKQFTFQIGVEGMKVCYELKSQRVVFLWL
jgi:hypothetical protein